MKGSPRGAPDSMSRHSASVSACCSIRSPSRSSCSSRSAANDPFRKHLVSGGGFGGIPKSIKMAPAYTAWASRYMHEYGADKEPFGRFAVNMRTNAAQNPIAAMKAPMTLSDYDAARMIGWPLSR